MTDRDIPNKDAEWPARTLIKGDPFITVGVQDNGEVLVGFGAGTYVITIREETP